MRTLFFSAILFGFGVTGFAQQTHSKTTTKNNPNESWTIHEEYDDQGNLISRDSTYTSHYSFSYGDGDFKEADLDSIVRHMRSQFKENLGEMNLDKLLDQLGSDHFSGSFFNDDQEDHFDDVFKQFIQSMNDFQEQFFSRPHQKYIPRARPDDTPPSEETPASQKI